MHYCRGMKKILNFPNGRWYQRPVLCRMPAAQTAICVIIPISLNHLDHVMPVHQVEQEARRYPTEITGSRIRFTAEEYPDMPGSGIDYIVIPIVAMISLAAWLIAVAYAASHPQWGSRRSAHRHATVGQPVAARAGHTAATGRPARQDFTRAPAA